MMIAANPGNEREFHFSSADFEIVRKLIYDKAGISLAPVKQDMVYSRLARRLRALHMTSFDEYLQHLQGGQGDDEWETFVNSLTTNLTAFFREAHHFEVLAQQLIGLQPDLRHRSARIWCSAASTGEEPYSLAMTACETFDSYTPPVEIIASDIDTHVLATAARGVYAMERVKNLGQDRLRRFFLKGAGRQAGLVRVRPELQKLLRFTQINLLEKLSVEGPFDALFCRNVMIYFDKPTQYAILKKFAPLLREDGLLYAGHSESFLHAADVFRSLGRTVYERADTGRSARRNFNLRSAQAN